MNRTCHQIVKRWLPAIMLAGVMTTSGCSYIVFLGYLLGGPPSIEPDYDVMTKKSLSDKGVKVAVVCFAPEELRWNFTNVDKDIAKFVAHQLHAHKMHVVSPDRVQEWLDKNDDWDKPEEIIEATGATHVVYIDVHKYNLYAENSHELYEGRAELIVSVFEKDKDGDVEKVYTKEVMSKYPLEQPRSTADITYEKFRLQYLTRLSEDVGRLFYEHWNGDDLADVI